MRKGRWKRRKRTDCHILLREVRGGRSGHDPAKGRGLARFRETLFLRRTGAQARGWLIEVLRAVERIGTPAFTLDDVYAAEAALVRLYPGNNNVRPKIRQQLQVLRDQGLIVFEGRGCYRLRRGD